MSERTDSGRGYRRWALIVLVAASMVAAAWIWPSLWRGASEDNASGAASSGLPEAGMTWFDEGERDEVPDLEGSTLEDEQLALADLRGEVVVVNVWGSWCVPCREEAPDLARLARETKPDGVQFLGIDTRDNKAAASAFVRKYRIPYPSLFDPDGSLMVAFNGIIPISAVPSTIVIDSDGGVAARVVGKVTYSTLSGLVDDVLAEDQDSVGTAEGGSP